MMRIITYFRNTSILILVLGLVYSSTTPVYAAPGPVVKSAYPNTAVQNTIDLVVEIKGSKFNDADEVIFCTTGVSECDEISVKVKNFKVKDSKTIEATIDVSDVALGDYDIEVRSSSGRRGRGTQLFKVTESSSSPPKYAEVTLSGAIESVGPASFGLEKNTSEALELNSFSGVDRGDPVSMIYNFSDTTIDNCTCRKGKKWDNGTVVACSGNIAEHLRSVEMRWVAVIHVDTSGLQEPGMFETSSQGGHSIDIRTYPGNDELVLWIPGGPSKSGVITVELLPEPDTQSDTRTFVFNPEGSPSMIHVWTGKAVKGKRTFMRCPVSDSITVEVTPVL